MPPTNDTAEALEDPGSPRTNARRRLLRGGLAAGPVLMTVASRPVLGQAIACSPSAATSINLATSLNHNCTIPTGLTPEEWKARASQWPSPYVGEVAGTSSTTTTTTTSSTSTSSSLASPYRSPLRDTTSPTPTSTTSTTSSTSLATPYRSPLRPTTSTTSSPTTGTQSTGSSAPAGALPTAQADGTAFHCPTTGLGGRTFAQMSMLEVIDQTNVDSLGR